MTEKLVRLSDVEFYLRRTAQNMIDEAEKDAETLSDGERGQIGACVLALRELANNVHRLPTVDAVDVVHARWEDDRMDTKCTACGTAFNDDMFWNHGDIIWPKYCPNCGAKMDAGVQEDGEN